METNSGRQHLAIPANNTLGKQFDLAAAIADKTAVVARKTIKGAAWSLLASTGLATVLQFAPQLVSQSAADYMSEQGFDPALLEQFQATDVRVYERDNPLMPFHMAGHTVRRMWSQDDNVFLKIIGAPIVFHHGLDQGFDRLRSDSRLAATSYSTSHANPADRSVMIAATDATLPTTEWLREMTGIRVEHLTFGQHSEADMVRTLAQHSFLHEVRHGDQSKTDGRTLKESDADSYSLHVAALGGTSPSLVGEARVFLIALRTVSAVLYGESSHATALALRRGAESHTHSDDPLEQYAMHMRAENDGSAFVATHLALRNVTFDSDVIPSSMDRASAYYHAASALLDQGIANRDDENDTIALYVQAMDYLDAASGGGVIDRSIDHRDIDVSHMIEPIGPHEHEFEPAASTAEPPQQLARAIKPPAV